MTNLTWDSTPNGKIARQHPIRLRRDSALGGGVQYTVQYAIDPPVERDGIWWREHYDWAVMYLPDGLTRMEAANFNEGRALVAEHIDHILATIAADHQGAPEASAEVTEPLTMRGPQNVITVPTEPLSRGETVEVDLPNGRKVVLEPPAEPGPIVFRMDERAHLAEQLREVLAHLTVQIDTTRQMVRDGAGQMFSAETTPEQALDANGRPLLTDLYVAKANALAALANLIGGSS
jgi:antitoxin component of MazEF toxin-antitoxin module